jgi:allophanate hydrolase subunit 2
MIAFIRPAVAPLWTDRPADPFAARRLNDLLDRTPAEPSWEAVRQGLRIHATADVVVFCAGTVFPPATRVKAGETATLAPIGPGFRDYVVAVPVSEAGPRRWVSPDAWGYLAPLRVRAGGGPEYSDACLEGGFRIAATDRLGIRLVRIGPAVPALPPILSAPVGWGTIQLPPDGNPIILGPDAASTGGYPRVGWVVPEDLRVLGQAGPSDRIDIEMTATLT